MKLCHGYLYELKKYKNELKLETKTSVFFHIHIVISLNCRVYSESLRPRTSTATILL